MKVKTDIKFKTTALLSTDAFNVLSARVFEIYGALVLRSPVDTGSFRRDWNVSIAPMGAGKAFFHAEITNNMPYTKPIVEGSPTGKRPWPSAEPKTVEVLNRIFSKQSPDNMLDAIMGLYGFDDILSVIAEGIDI